MKLRYKFNLLALGVLLAVGAAMSIAGVLTIERLAFTMNRKLMEMEVVKVLREIREADQVLTDSGVASVESYLRRAQADILEQYRDYRFGSSGRMTIFGEPDLPQLLPQMTENRPIDEACLTHILQQGRGFGICSHEKGKRFLFYDRFPKWHWIVLLQVDNSEMLAERNAFLYQVAFILVLGLACGLLVFAWFAKSISAPVQQLSEAAQAISTGDWERALPPASSIDEVDDLTRAFGHMADNLSAAQRDLERQARALQHTNTRLHLEITEHQQTQQEIYRLNEDLEQRVWERTAQLKAANDELEAFAYSVSHDLRAPLRSIDGFSQALLDDYGARLDGEGQEFLRRVRTASQRMGQLIDDLLSLSRITRGEMMQRPVDLSAMAGEVAQDLRASDPRRQVEVVVQAGVVAEGDPRLLRVVLENLLGNAWKFTGRCDRPRIEFGCQSPGGERHPVATSGAVFFVRDNGAGFDPAYADKLFGVFQRLHRADEYPGTGIGLATVQRIVHRHGGRVWARGEVGKGASFFFTL